MRQSALVLEPDFVRFLLAGGNAFVNAPALLADLSGEQAVHRCAETTKTIAEITAHLHYWQTWFYAGATGQAQRYPEHAETSWPDVPLRAWSELRDDFLQGLEAIKALCQDVQLLNRPFAEGVDIQGGHNERTVGMTLLYTVALHNGHHYGQIISLRQFMGLWPPPGGGVSW